MKFVALLALVLYLGGADEAKADCTGQQLDLAILGDRSRSMLLRLGKLRSNIKALVRHIGVSPGGNHFGIIPFFEYPSIALKFSPAKHQKQRKVLKIVHRRFRYLGRRSGTRIDRAMKRANHDLFTSAGGDRPYAKNVMVIFSDGRATGRARPNFTPFKDLISALEGKNVHLIAFGVGRRISRYGLREIVGPNGVVVYTKAHLIKAIHRICEPPIDGGFTNFTPASECSVSCGTGNQTFTRTCTNPPPSNGGKDCQGDTEKTVECNNQTCPPPCTAGLDVALVLDKSGSIGRRNIPTVINFLFNLTKRFDPAPDADHFAFITFSTTVSLRFNFANQAFYDRNTLLTQIANEPRTVGGTTRTDLALEAARDDVFTIANGDRQDKPNIMIVLTDGRPFPVRRNIPFVNFARRINRQFQRRNVNIVVVGIGNGINNIVLRQIAGPNGYVVHVNTFGQLNERIDKIKASACSA